MAKTTTPTVPPVKTGGYQSAGLFTLIKQLLCKHSETSFVKLHRPISTVEYHCKKCGKQILVPWAGPGTVVETKPWTVIK